MASFTMPPRSPTPDPHAHKPSSPHPASARFELIRLRPLFALGDLKLDFVALAQIFKDHFGRQPRAMEEDVIAAIVRHDESKAFVSDDFLDGSEHDCHSSLLVNE